MQGILVVDAGIEEVFHVEHAPSMMTMVQMEYGVGSTESLVL